MTEQQIIAEIIAALELTDNAARKRIVNYLFTRYIVDGAESR